MKHHNFRQKSADFPLYFRIARALNTLLNGRRGEYFFYSILGKLGLLNRIGRFPFFDSHIYIPLTIPETLFIRDFSLFQALREVNFANVIYQSFGNSSTFIDCGAAFGQISYRMAKLCPNISNIIAIEPNPDSFFVLRKNLDLLKGKNTYLFNTAVSNFRGKGTLCFPHGQSDPHSAYIKEADFGAIDVIRIDDLQHLYTRDVAIKLDVEGGELAAIEGAIETISKADNVCFFIEIHPDVLARNNCNAEDLLMTITNIRDTKWFIADAPLTMINPSKPFFEQVNRKIYDVIGVSTRAS
ncbi:FkbM family methyltransferase [Methylocaldum sp. 14B]|jgi:FkbM family methyltransferase|uniref:FkbM family methyltransferase n=1 Tax=Methylocaldum sp. 14B TaxID=1912213 RepID=UPI00098A76AE|nr:FkbM family methyltransferase [Methylocaldum sp. 14B]